MHGVGDKDSEVMGSADMASEAMSSALMSSGCTDSEVIGSAPMSSGDTDSVVMGSATMSSGDISLEVFMKASMTNRELVTSFTFHPTLPGMLGTTLVGNQVVQMCKRALKRADWAKDEPRYRNTR
jgi:hypothetical protein